MLSIKVVVVLSTISMFFILKHFELPEMMNYHYYYYYLFAPAVSSSDFLNMVASWLRPPYLYLVINCIIITIVATSKLQSKFDHYYYHAFPPPPLKTQHHQVTPSAFDHHFSFSNTAHNIPVFHSSYVPTNIIEKVSEDDDMYGGGGVAEIKNITEKMKLDYNRVSDDLSKESKDVKADSYHAAEEDHDAAKLVLNSNKLIINRAPDQFSKPPPSSRFGHRKIVKTTPEGGKTLRVVSSKPKRQETLESTWKTITDGRPMPLTRHLRKSDTWETTTNHPTDFQMMTKSETFNDRSNINRKNKSQLLARSSGSPGKLKKDPSLGQDELNKRVEAFITKFNEDMRLQRQESINQYMEMINRGAAP